MGSKIGLIHWKINLSIWGILNVRQGNEQANLEMEIGTEEN
jgi:hypothetical protein